MQFPLREFIGIGVPAIVSQFGFTTYVKLQQASWTSRSVSDLTMMRVLAAKVDLKSALSITKDEAALSTMLHMVPNLPCEHTSEAIFQVVTEETQ
jgi:hypothetical protein